MSSLPSPQNLNTRQIDLFFQSLLRTKGHFNYVCREILEFLEFGSGSAKDSRSAVFSRPSDFVDDYMLKMEDLLNQHTIFDDALSNGIGVDSIEKTGNPKIDLRDFLVKVLRKEEFYQVKTGYLATELSDESRQLMNQ
jgi:hypothetical protein